MKTSRTQVYIAGLLQLFSKSIVKVSVAIATLALAQTSLASMSYSMPAVEGGFRWSSAELDQATSNKMDIGFQLGGSVVLNFTPEFGLKTGLLYVERPFKSEVAGTEVKGKVSYFDVPAFFMFKLEDYAGIYAGPSFSFKLADEITPGTMTDIKGMVMPITLGAQFKFASNLGVNIFFETLPSEMAKGIKNSRAVGATLLVTFD